MEGSDGGDQVGVSCSGGAEVAYSVVDTFVIVSIVELLVIKMKMM